MEVKWNLNGNWLLTASRDHLCKLFDIRNLKEELQVFRGHKKEATGAVSVPAPAHWSVGRCAGITLTLSVRACLQLWPGILSTKACSPAEVPTVLCSSGTPGEDKSKSLRRCHCAATPLVGRVSADSCGLFQGGEGGGGDGDGP